MATQKHTSKSSQPSKKSGGSLAPRVSKKATKAPPKQQKTKSKNLAPSRHKQKRTYTEEELGVPKLNMITPVGVQKPKGKKRGKVFVDDTETMQTILAIVSAEQEGHIESKMMRARQMEEIREARRKEAEAKEEQRKHFLETKKDELRKKRKKAAPLPLESLEQKPKSAKSTKKVSFG